MPLDSQEFKTALGDLQSKLEKKFGDYENQQKEYGSVAAEIKADLSKMSEDFAAMKKDVTATNDEIAGLKQKGVKLDKGDAPKSMGQKFAEGEAWKSFCEGKSGRARMEFKNTILGEGGSPQNPTDTLVPKDYQSGIVAGAFRSLQVMDIIPRGQTSSNQVQYTREASWTNGAAETAEGGQKPEATLTFESVDAPVRTVAHILKVSKQVLDDAPMLRSYIDGRMTHGVLQRTEAQILAGNGISPNMSGIAVTGNHTDLTLVTADNDLDAANRAKYQVIASDYMADVYLMNPADWGRLERTKTGISGDDSYLAGGDNAISYLANGMQPLLWGLPVVLSNSVTAGKFICMARDAVMFWEREGVTVEIFEQDEDNVQKNLLTIRAEARGAFSVFRPAAVVYGDLPDAA